MNSIHSSRTQRSTTVPQAVLGKLLGSKMPSSSARSTTAGCPLVVSPRKSLKTGVRFQSSRAAVVRVVANGEKQIVAITGATGLVGSRLVSRLVSEGHQVRVLSRSEATAEGKFRGLPNVTCYGPQQWAQAINVRFTANKKQNNKHVNVRRFLFCSIVTPFLAISFVRNILT